MKNVRDIYKEGCNSDYEPLLNSFEYGIVVAEDEDDYQGSSWRLFKDRDRCRYGYLEFGWGSCSGCDALQACSSYEDLEKLQKFLHSRIHWFETLKECKKWFMKHNWEGSWCGRHSELLAFVTKVKNLR